jgi:RNA polymerase sigma-70 factor (ECF subfamily)
MAVLQTSLASFGNAVGPRQPRPIAGNRRLRQGLASAPVPPEAVSAADSSASPEWILIQQAVAGKSDSQNALFAAYSSRLYRTAFAVLRNKEYAEDALQDALCNAHIHLRSFQGRSSFVTWLTRIVLNSALMIRRRQNSRAALSLHEVMEDQEGGAGREFADIGPNPEEICRAAELEGFLAAEVERLPSKLQTALQLREVEGLSIEESSRKLGLGKNAFKSRLLRARRRVIDSLNNSLNTAPNSPRLRHSNFHRPPGRPLQRASAAGPNLR